MKIKHYRAPDMRQALRQVRDAQGPDAVILSSRRIAGGVEVVAAVDHDADDPSSAGGTHGGVDHYATSRPVAPPASSPAPARDFASTLRAASTIDERTHAVPARHAAQRPIESWNEGEQHAADASDYAALARRLAGVDGPAAHSASADVNEELRTLRRMLETQLATLAWNDLSRRAPIQTELLRQLTVLGLANDLAGELVAQLPGRIELCEAHRYALATLSRRIETTGERWMESGGVVALVGATGVGKTTLMAKLAARWVLRHGPRDLALVSTDSVRIGAQEQIHTLGRLLGAPAYAIEGPAELAKLLDHLAGRRLVLIDTAGLGQRDPRLAIELAALASTSDRIETSLVLSAAAQAGAIEQQVEQFTAARPASAMLTKLDEATSLGGSISALIRASLPLAYVSEGQRVPEDLSPARAHQLIARAVELARQAGASADEDLLRRRFGAVAHGLA